MSVLKSEWLKLISVRTTWGLLGAMIFIEGLAAGLTTSLGDVSDLRKRNIATLIIGTHLAIVFMFTLGALLYVAVNAGLGMSILSNRGIDVDADKAVNGYIGVGVGLVLGCLFGVALGALLRNQILTVVTGMVIFLLAGTAALFIGNDVGQYFPGESLLALQGTPGADKTLLSQTNGGLVLGAYCVVLGIAGMVFTRQREIT